MCWKDENELYNNGGAFKITARDERGVIVTIIADNYFGYCKKEVKTQISYAANLYGLCEEEHAGGALVYASYDLGEEFDTDKHVRSAGIPSRKSCKLAGAAMELQPEGYAIDKHTRTSFTCRATSLSICESKPSPGRRGRGKTIKLLAGKIYVRPSGYRCRWKSPRQPRLAPDRHGGRADPLPQALHRFRRRQIGNFQVHHRRHHSRPGFHGGFQKGLRPGGTCCPRLFGPFPDPAKIGSDTRPILSPERSLGSVIKLFTPSAHDYSDEFNQWLSSIPQYLLELLFVVKRFYKVSWGDNWREHFSVDIINGTPGNELKCDNRKLVSNFLRVGYDADGSWRVFGLRKDFHPAAKVQMEDDITASVVVPAGALQHLNPDYTNPSVKFVHNCETACSSARTRPFIAATTSRRKRTCPSREISSPISSR
jgi:phosphoenolpyruvate carboxykinase (diphosphate)